MLTILDATTQSACAAAATQQEWCEALIAAWSGGSVTARLFAPDGATLRRTLTLGPFTITGTTSRSAVCAAHLADTAVSTGAPGLWVFRAGSTDIFSIDAGTGAASVNHTGAIKTLCTPTLEGVTFTAPSGLPVDNWPAWRVGQTANTWAYIGSSTLASIDPEDNVAINGIAGNAAWHGTDGQSAVIDGWSAAGWDETTHEYTITGQGGHNNYGGNEGYLIDIGADSPAWDLYRLPSGRLPNTSATALIDGDDSTGVYSIDGEPRSTHGYGNSLVVPGLGPMLVRLGSTYPASAQSNKCWVFDTTTGESNLVFEADASSLGSFPGGTSIGGAYGACCYVPARGANSARIYACGSGSNVWLWYANVGARNATWTGAKIGSGNLFLYGTGGYGGMVYIPSLDRILSVSWNGSALEFVLIHPDTAATTTLSLSGSVASGFFAASGRFGFDWAPDLGKLLMWNNVTNRAQISTATPNAGSELTAWALGTLAVDPSNSITPRAVHDGSSGPWQGAGTLLRYSQHFGGLMLASEVGQPLMFYATR